MNMEIKTFAELLDAHGADFERWPPEHAPEARLLLEQDAAARRALAQARALDEYLDAHETGPLPDELRTRVMDAIERPAVASAGNITAIPRRRGSLPRLYYGGMALAAALAALWLAGTPMPSVAPVSGIAQSPAPVVAASGDAVDLFVLAMADPFMENAEADMMIGALDQTASVVPAKTDEATVDVFLESLMADTLTPVAQ